jgi:hypothetical protein
MEESAGMEFAVAEFAGVKSGVLEFAGAESAGAVLEIIIRVLICSFSHME